MSGLLARMTPTRWAVLGAVVVGVAAIAVLNFALVDEPPARNSAKRCDRGDLGCYEDRYIELVADAGPTRAMRAFRADYNRDPAVRARCHPLAHAIGHAAGELYGDVAKAYRHGDRFCASGYYHGAMEAIVAGPDRSRALDRPDEICRALRRGSIDEGNCAHGLGHGFMAVRANDVPTSLRLCDRLSADYERHNCYDGVFMQNVMAEHDREHPSRYLDRSRPLRLCSVLPPRYGQSCVKRQVLYALEVTGADFRGTFGLCRRFGSGTRAVCDRQVGEAAADLNISSRPGVSSQIRGTARICGLAPDVPAGLRCVEGAAGYFVFQYDRADEARAFCGLFGKSARARCDRAVREAG